MATHRINSDTLGETTPAAAERFARFCTAAAEKAGFNIDFEISYRTVGYSPESVGGQISNICWECSWYGSGPLRNAAIAEAAEKISAFVNVD